MGIVEKLIRNDMKKNEKSMREREREKRRAVRENGTKC